MDIEMKKALYEAFESRDVRFDGKFFVAVSSTGIYCRPVCQAKMPKFENCTFFKSAAEAEQAGYRPCLVCRPELAPDSWETNNDNIANLLAKYIEENCSSGESLSSLAGRFGYSDRHLRRAFKEEFNVTPVEYLQTCRLLLVKKLLTETGLSITDIAFASGFGSVRRLNDAFKNKYKLAPTDLRKHTGNLYKLKNSIKVGLGYRPPYRWNKLLEFLELRAVAGVELVKNGKYYRTIRETDKAGKLIYGWIGVENIADKSVLQVEISESLMPALSRVLGKVKKMFDLACDPNAIYGSIKAINKIRVNAFIVGTRLPGHIDEFEICVRAVLGQQITVKAAKTLAERVAFTFGKEIKTEIEGLEYTFPSAEDIYDLPGSIEDHLGPLGVTAARARAIKEIAALFAKQELEFDTTAEPEKIMRRLMQIRGVGPWTAKYIAMRALSYPDVFPETDAGVKEALAGYSTKELVEMSAKWSPWRSYAVIGIWNSL